MLGAASAAAVEPFELQIALVASIVRPALVGERLLLLFKKLQSITTTPPFLPLGFSPALSSSSESATFF